jgi:hypothetical protein
MPVGIKVADTTQALTRASKKPEMLNIAGRAALAMTEVDEA